MANLIKNIVAVSYIETSKLQNLVYIPRIGVRLQYWRDWQDLEIYGLASAEVTSKIEKKSKLYTTTLTVITAYDNVLATKHYAFLAKCADGSWYLIGGSGHPYPIVNTTDDLPGRTNDKSGRTMTIEYTDTLGLMPVLDRP